MTAKDNPNCQVSGTVFTSTSCNSTVEEGRGKLDRPIAGSINICPNALSDSPSDFEYQMNLFLRELISLLGFRTEFYAYFRDSNGNPRTARDSYGKPQKDASTSTVLVSKTPWITAGQLQVSAVS
jgi:leishmanolysin-like peptidase